MHSKKFSDLLQCAKNLLEPQCAVYFSAATNIWSHAARSLFCLAKNWMSQQDAVILHKRVTKLKKYIFLFCLINKNQHDNFHWVSVGAKPFEKQQHYFCICGVYLIYHKQDLRTASSFMVVAHYFSPFILALPYLSLTAQQAQKNNNIVVAHLLPSILVHLDMFLQCSSVWPTIVLNTLTSWAPHSILPRLFVTVLIGRLNSGQYSPEPGGSLRNIFKMLQKGKKTHNSAPFSPPSPVKYFPFLSAGQRRTNAHTRLQRLKAIFLTFFMQ